MPKYTFRLQTVQKLREARRDQQRAALAEALGAEQVLAERRAEIAVEQESLRGVQRAAATAPDVDVNRLLEAQRYGLVLSNRELELARQNDLLAIEIERRRQAVVEREREVRVLELLDERQRREHFRRQQRVEIKQLDEAAAVRHARHNFADQS